MEEIQRFRNKNSCEEYNEEVKEIKETFKDYRKRVMKFTEQVKHLIPDIHKRGFNTFHIDHKLSILVGYKKGIDAKEIGHISNLRLITKEENLKKGPYGPVL